MTSVVTCEPQASLKVFLSSIGSELACTIRYDTVRHGTVLFSRLNRTETRYLPILIFLNVHTFS